jgi:hypothetical protein
MDIYAGIDHRNQLAMTGTIGWTFVQIKSLQNFRKGA